eukprot:scaffold3055_cov402-Prasinococcus_capsulatus_cf.AAC.7
MAATKVAKASLASQGSVMGTKAADCSTGASMLWLNELRDEVAMYAACGHSGTRASVLCATWIAPRVSLVLATEDTHTSITALALPGKRIEGAATRASRHTRARPRRTVVCYAPCRILILGILLYVGSSYMMYRLGRSYCTGSTRRGRTRAQLFAGLAGKSHGGWSLGRGMTRCQALEGHFQRLAPACSGIVLLPAAERQAVQ